MALIFVDCEAWGKSPRDGQLTEFGAVEYETEQTFHGVIVRSRPSKENPAIPEVVDIIDPGAEMRVFQSFEDWLKKFNGRPVFVSDNLAYDWQWINDGFIKHLGRNPFGHSGRSIKDFYAGLTGDFRNSQEWKRLRVTKHDHHPVHDSMGNVEAFKRMVKGERP